MRFSDRVKALRQTAGLSQSQLADRAGVGLPTVKDYEGGRRAPTLETAQRLAAALGVDCRAFDGCKFTRADQTGKARPRKVAAARARKR
jgi:transcriptional regulator with XRE-family HTH domain